MFRFDKEQTVVDVAGVKCGGQPGEYPTVLCGTIFYGGHKIISDEKAGVFDHDAAEGLIREMEEMSDVTGNPCIIQTFGATPEAMVSYLEFVVDVSDKPFLIDSTGADAKMAGVDYCQEQGICDRVIYNSLNMSCEADEVAKVKESDIEASIVLGFNPMQSGVEGKIDIWDNGGSAVDEGIIPMAEDCGITKFFMDVAITPLGQGGGPALRTTFAEKSKWGYPVGSGIHNVPSAWDWLKTWKKEHKDAWSVCDIGSDLMQVAAGGDFCLYGPIENSSKVFPAVAMADCFMAEAAKDIGTEPVEGHPFNKLV
ncbi:tetrahydromethanopterin S-methyltransferase subunit H [Methanobrevibacter sp. 87.7]|uniref:tetrahydromethanopterin S-methyltransferase subunit H n=1 Tax=Methanobrevibacter sp. 87.7 TaxID=387957 RepID=UPI000B50554C|nr:tetrahydromethanopterin S-methyltransferase subunit H [Methanobrevibacter sp. 87.7]OWT33233.1 tetrahydromethanopterin S-methyltransferase subunit H [Methanobrevibacter sp. 87.7]